MRDELRKLGIDVLGALPWGEHLCYFYNTKQDLIDALVPYFKAGLENNEYCIWITSESLSEKEAEEAMAKAVPDFPQYLASQQIEIIPHTKWYLKGGTFNGKRVLNAWLDKLDRALASGYDGMRLTGDTAWLDKSLLGEFIDYEEDVNNAIGKYRMLALCTYPLHKYGASEIIDVESNHQYSITKHKGELTLIGSSEYQRLQHDLIEREKELKCLYDIDNIAEEPGITLDKLYQEVANLLPQSWQYSEVTCARIITNDKEFGTENYRETGWRQSADIKVRGERIGTVEVGYLEARPEADEGPFSQGERLLIEAVAERLGEITEHKQAEEELKESEEKYRTLVEEAIVGIMNVDLTGKITYVNKTILQATGYSWGELVGKNAFRLGLISDETIKVLRDRMKKKLMGQPPGILEIQYKRKDGEWIWLQIRGMVLRKHNMPVGIQIIGEEITEHKQAEEALLTIERKYRTFIESSHEVVFSKDRDGYYHSLNLNAAIGLGGTCIEDVEGKTDYDLLPKEQAVALREIDKQIMESGQPMEVEEVVRDSQGKNRIYLSYKWPTYDDKDRIAGISCFATDITEHKQAEAKLRGSEGILGIASQITSDVVYERDLQTGIATFYGDIDAHLGYEPGEYPRTMEGWREHVHPEDLARIENQSLDQLEPGVPHSIEYRMRKKDGTYMTWWDRIIVIRDEETGQPLKFIGAATDITEHERVEETLRENSDYLERLSNFISDAVFTIKIPERVIEWVNDAFRIFGYDIGECIGRTTEFLYADENEFLDFGNKLKNAMATGKDILHAEQLLKRKNGEVFSAEINVTFHKEKGEVVRVTSIVRDLTEHKQAEKSQMKPLRAVPGKSITQLQKRFIREGFKDLSENAGIRLIFNLCRYRPECDKDIKKCIKKFKTVRALLSAPDQELQQFGVCSRGLFTVKLFRELPAAVLKQKIMERSIYKSSKEVFDYLYYTMRDLKNEVFKVIYLNNRSQIIDTVDLFEGTKDSIYIRPREVVESAINHGAAGLIFVHNHPTGDPNPSKTDKQLTRDLAFVGMILQINVLDHIIIGENSYFSFADDGLIQKYQDNFLNLKIRGVLASGLIYQHYNNLPGGLHLQRQVNTLSNIVGHLVRK